MKLLDILSERPIDLREAAEVAGVHPKTVARWIKAGHKGRFLEGAYIGRSLKTSREAIVRFSAGLSQAKPDVVTSGKAIAYLESHGIRVRRST